MTTIIEANENSAVINVPFDELKKLGLKIGDEVEITTNDDALIVRPTENAERKRKIAGATEKVFSRWNNVFVELAKGTDEK